MLFFNKLTLRFTRPMICLTHDISDTQQMIGEFFRIIHQTCTVLNNSFYGFTTKGPQFFTVYNGGDHLCIDCLVFIRAIHAIFKVCRHFEQFGKFRIIFKQQIKQ